MTIEDKIKVENRLIEKQQKYQRYHQVKLISMIILLVKKYYPRINNK